MPVSNSRTSFQENKNASRRPSCVTPPAGLWPPNRLIMSAPFGQRTMNGSSRSGTVAEAPLLPRISLWTTAVSKAAHDQAWPPVGAREEGLGRASKDPEALLRGSPRLASSIRLLRSFAMSTLTAQDGIYDKIAQDVQHVRRGVIHRGASSADAGRCRRCGKESVFACGLSP